MDRCQCTWVAMIGEMHELIVEYLGNGFKQELASYIENVLSNQGSFRVIYAIDAIAMFDTIVYIRAIVAIVLIPVPKFYYQPRVCWRQSLYRDMGCDTMSFF